MANELALVTADTVRIVGIPNSQYTIPAEEAVTAGQAARLSTTTGKLTKANGTVTAEARVKGIATRTPEAVGLGLTIIRKGFLDGYDLSALAYDAPIYLSDTDGRLSTVAGTVSVLVGRVVSAFAAGLNSADKILEIDIPL